MDRYLYDTKTRAEAMGDRMRLVLLERLRLRLSLCLSLTLAVWYRRVVIEGWV